jgi:hypothetical protein
MVAVALALGVSNQVQAAPISTGSAWISNLSYHLEDLDPNDGVTPWVQFHGVGVSAGYFTEQEGSHHITLGNDVFAQPIGSISSPLGEFTVGGSGTAYTGSSSLNASSVQNLNGAGAQPSDWLYYNSAGVLSHYGSGLDDSGVPIPLEGEQAWTLSANTALVIDGVSQVNATVDLAQFTQGSLLQDMVAGQYGLQLTSQAFTTVQLHTGTNEDGFGDSADLFASARQVLNSQGVFNDPEVPASDSFQNSFSVRLANTTAGQLRGHLFMGVGLMNVLDVTPIPEPGTFALMGLGLGLVGWRANKARRT